MTTETTMLTPRRLQPGDRVRLLSPASPPDPEKVAAGIRLLESWGLKIEVGLTPLTGTAIFSPVKTRIGWLIGMRRCGTRASAPSLLRGRQGRLSNRARARLRCCPV